MHVLLERFAAFAAQRPGAEAVVVASVRARPARYRSVTYGELRAAVDRYAAALRARGLRPGERVLVLIPPGEALIAWSYAVMAAGAVPVYLDPAMGAANLRRCIVLAAPDALVGVRLAHVLRVLWRKTFRSVRLAVVAHDAPVRDANAAAQPAEMTTGSTAEAAIVFTSGGTGPPKGVVYEQATMRAQLELLDHAVQPVPSTRDLPLLPVFALLNAAFGICSVFLRPRPRSPLAFDADALIDVVNDVRIRSSFGSPPLWEKIASACLRTGRSLPHVEQIFFAGAPVTPEQAALVQSIAPRAEVFMPYGCTEALPVTMPRASEYAEAVTTAAHGGEQGTWLGRAVAGVDVAIVALGGAPPREMTMAHRLPALEIGEIVVKGPNVARSYAGAPDEMRLSQIPDGEDFWHRTGDAGYHDGRGNLYFLGRAQHVVRCAERTCYPVPTERAFNRDPRVRRCALVRLAGGERAGIVIEPHPKHRPRSRQERARFAADMRKLAARDPLTAPVRDVFFRRALPVDPRHNAKIQRTLLGEWASRARPS